MFVRAICQPWLVRNPGGRLFQGADAEVSAQLRLFAEQTHDFVGVADPWGRILYLNPAARKRLGVADASELSLTDVFPVEEFAIYYNVARPQLLRTGAWSGQIRVNVAGEGAVPMYVSTSATLGPGGEINGLVVHAREVPRTNASEPSEGLEIDEVTGLLARSAFEHQVRLALAVAERDDDHCALVLVDVVGMGDTIETLGEVAAVKVLHSLARRMTRLARTVDVVGRLGGAPACALAPRCSKPWRGTAHRADGARIIDRSARHHRRWRDRCVRRFRRDVQPPGRRRGRLDGTSRGGDVVHAREP